MVLVLSRSYLFDVSPAPESYDSSGNQSFERRGCLSLFRPPSFMFCCYVYVLGHCLVQTGSQWGVKKGKKNDVSLLYSEVFVFGSAGRKKNRSLIMPQEVSVVISPLLTKLLEGAQIFTSHQDSYPFVWNSERYCSNFGPVSTDAIWLLMLTLLKVYIWWTSTSHRRRLSLPCWAENGIRCTALCFNTIF